MKKISFFTALILILLFQQQGLSQYWGKSGIKGEGPTVKKTLDVAPFNNLSLGISADVFLEPGSSQQVSVEGQENIIANIKTKVKMENGK